MATLGIYTKDFCIYHELLKTLRRRHHPYITLTEPHNIPKSIGVILTTSKEKHLFSPQHPTLSCDTALDMDHAIDRALHKLTGKDQYTRLFIGIDPGERPGIAIIGDDVLLNTKHVQHPEEITKEIEEIISIYLSDNTTIKIGHGSRLIRNRIINSLMPLGIPIEIVDETKSNPQNHVKRYRRDEHAAVSIALQKGGRVDKEQPLEPTKGAIRDTQRRSRRSSEGQRSISSEQASRVLKGELTLLEALEERK